jgi:hypothetical protein
MVCAPPHIHSLLEIPTNDLAAIATIRHMKDAQDELQESNTFILANAMKVPSPLTTESLILWRAALVHEMDKVEQTIHQLIRTDKSGSGKEGNEGADVKKENELDETKDNINEPDETAGKDNEKFSLIIAPRGHEDEVVYNEKDGKI